LTYTRLFPYYFKEFTVKQTFLVSFWLICNAGITRLKVVNRVKAVLYSAAAHALYFYRKYELLPLPTPALI